MKSSDLICTDMVWADVGKEIIELKDALLGREGGVLEELCDVYSMVLGTLWCKYGINLPVVWKTSAKKWEKRVVMWEILFNYVGLKFDKKYLVRGGNYERKHKLERVIKMAIEDQFRKSLG